MYKVVIVEDEDLIRKGLRYTFEWLEYKCIVVAEASNGKEALKVIEAYKPDIVITDIKMPIMGGLEMLGSFKERDFETIIVTGYAEFDYAKKAIEYNVSEFLLKPISHDELGQVLQKLISIINEKKIIKSIKEKVKDYSELCLVDLELYYQSNSYNSQYTTKVLQYIEKYYNQKISLEVIADEIEISSTHLSKKFKKDTSHTFNDFLNKYRIQKALEFMYNSDMKIYEIAEKVGFADYKYFIKVFKNHMNHTPSEFMQTNVFVKLKKNQT